MRNMYFVVFFVLILLVHLAALYVGNPALAQLTKPMLLLTLIGYFFGATITVGSGLKKWIALALVFSLAGDVLLMFVSTNEQFFIAGLVSFLLAHLFYIFCFHSIRVYEKIKGKVFLLLLVFIYYVGLMHFLNPWLHEMRLPVRIYSVVICFMLMLAMHMLFIKNKKAGTKMFAGAFLFVISDSILAINKFYSAFMEADILIMLTYALAQFFLVQGAVEYINGLKKEIEGS